MNKQTTIAIEWLETEGITEDVKTEYLAAVRESTHSTSTKGINWKIVCDEIGNGAWY